MGSLSTLGIQLPDSHVAAITFSKLLDKKLTKTQETPGDSWPRESFSTETTQTLQNPICLLRKQSS